MASEFTSRVIALQQERKNACQIQAKIDELQEKLSNSASLYTSMLEAQQLISGVSDKNTNAILDYVMGVINKTLSQLFPNDSREISIKKTIYRNAYPQITLELTGSNGHKRDLTLQSGTGLRQVISFLFVVSIIEIRKGRRLLVMDELLSGLHPSAKKVIFDIIDIFAEDGFEFACVEYGVNDRGKIYNVENINGKADVHPVDGEYNNEVYIFHRDVENVDLNEVVNEVSSDEN